MRKLLRIVSTIMIAVGLLFLAVYINSLRMDSADILNRPSYYLSKNLSLMFIAGIVVLVFSVLGSFFSWFKKLDPAKEALPNAGYASQEEIETWVSGSTAVVEDTSSVGKTVALNEDEDEDKTAMHPNDPASAKTVFTAEPAAEETVFVSDPGAEDVTVLDPAADDVTVLDPAAEDVTVLDPGKKETGREDTNS